MTGIAAAFEAETVAQALATLDDELRAIGDLGEQVLPPNERTRQEQRRRLLKARRTVIANAWADWRTRDARRAESQRRHDALTAVRAELLRRLDAVGAMVADDSDTRRRQDDEVAALEASLRAIRIGAEFWGTTRAVPTPLAQALAAAGFVAEPGQPSAWVGTLPALEERISDLSQDLDDIAARLTPELAAVERERS